MLGGGSPGRTLADGHRASLRDRLRDGEQLPSPRTLWVGGSLHPRRTLESLAQTASAPHFGSNPCTLSCRSHMPRAAHALHMHSTCTALHARHMRCKCAARALHTHCICLAVQHGRGHVRARQLNSLGDL